MGHQKQPASGQRDVEKFLGKGKFRFHGSDVLVFIPVHNEERSIADVVQKVKKSCDFDILVIDDRSDDATPDILSKLDVEVLTRIKNHDSRIINGLEVGCRLGYNHIIKIDGDGQHNPRDITRLYRHAQNTNADIVIGSRHLNGFTGNIRTLKGIGMWFCARLVTLLNGERITDSTSGFKIWSKRACQPVIQAAKEGKLKDSATYHIEDLLLAHKKHLKVEEIEVTMREREYGNSKSFSPKEMFTFPLNLMRSLWRTLFR